MSPEQAADISDAILRSLGRFIRENPDVITTIAKAWENGRMAIAKENLDTAVNAVKSLLSAAESDENSGGGGEFGKFFFGPN
jgi:hypothetical protein